MAKFNFKTAINFVVRSEDTQVINGKVITTPRKVAKLGPGTVEVKDEEVIERIRNDQQFNTSSIIEITAEDEEVMEIKRKKAREAEEEIKERKRKK